MSNSTSSVPSEFKEKVNEVSLLLMMTSANDAPGISLLSELLDGLATEASHTVGCKKFVDGWQDFKTRHATVASSSLFEPLKQFITTLAAFCERPEDASFDQPAVGSHTSAQQHIHREFLPEFIENHKMQLEEFESWLLDLEFGGDSGEDTGPLVKRYLHSLKGDAGSLGLGEFESLCHTIEDILADTGVKSISGQLILFKEWAVTYLSALATGVSSEPPNEFSKRFRSACSLVAPPKAACAPSSQSTATKPSSLPNEQYQLTGEKDIFQEFVAEAEEHLGNVESIVLEADGSYSKDSVDTIFRGIHSLKGGSAYFSLKEVTETSHRLESLLDEVRSGKRVFDEQLTALVLTYIDLQKTLLSAAKKTVASDGTLCRIPASIEFLAAVENYTSGQPNKSALDPRTSSLELAAPPLTTGNLTKPATPAIESAKVAATAPSTEKLDVKNFVKVDTLRLDHLIDSIGEMVIYSSMLIRRCRELLPQHEDVQSVTHRVEKFTRDLQDVGMSMRLVPIKGLFQKMSRLVWDTSKKINKEIDFSMEGEDTELDRNLIDKLADPLMHMVRNALDHGVESPDERISAGKARAGRVHLSASHSGGAILIKIRDDGRGLNPEKLLAKAREKGVIAPDQKLSEQEVFQLIFAAGFSTAAVVTDISGRGVGMDVVRRNVESLRGRIHIESEVGAGTTFTIELPLTLAIVDGVEVSVGNDRLIIPSNSIVEFIKPSPQTLHSALDRGETVQFRGRYLPIYRLSELYDFEARHNDPLKATLVIVDNNDEYVALMVDDILGELSTVIKSLGPMFTEVKGVSGCAVMPNGDVALILDIRSLVQLARAEYRQTGRHFGASDMHVV